MSTPIGEWVSSLMCQYGGAKDARGPPLSILHTLYKQRVLMTVQCTQLISILRILL